jgi:hypothetical protein
VVIERQSAKVDNTLLELFYKNREEKLDRDFPQVMALFSYHMLGMEQGLASLQELQKQKLRVQVWAEENIREYYSTDLVQKTGIDDWIWSTKEAEERKQKLQFLFIPVLSFSLVSDIVRLNDHRPFVRMILWALFKGIKVGVLSMGADPQHPIWRQRKLDQSSPFLQQIATTQLQQLKGTGVRLLEPNQIMNWLTASQSQRKKRILAKEDIVYAAINQEKEIIVAKNTIITPLAIDIAKEYNITIISE